MSRLAMVKGNFCPACTSTGGRVITVWKRIARYGSTTTTLLTISRGVDLPYGAPFTFSFYTYHETVRFVGQCSGAFYRIGD